MSDFEEKKENTEITPEAVSEDNTAAEDTESTVFSDPVAHREVKTSSGKKKRITAVITAFVCVLLIGGGVFAVTKLIPEKEDEKNKTSTDEFSIVNCEAENAESITVTSKSGSYKFVPETVKSESDESEATETLVWRVDGMDNDVLSMSATQGVADQALSMSAIMEIDKKTAAECGLEGEDAVKVEVAEKNGAGYTLTVGTQSPDGRGMYVSLSDKIYLVSDASVSALDFELLDLADISGIPAVTFEGDVSEYYAEGGEQIATFDSMVLSGANYTPAATVTPADSADSLSTFVINGKQKRNAESQVVADYLSLFTESITVSGAYTLDVTDESIKKTGLDNPDISITINIKGESKNVSFKKQEDGGYAVIYTGAKLIKKINGETFALADYTEESFYSTMPVQYTIYSLSSFTVTLDGKDYRFDLVTATDEDNNQTLSCTYGGKEMDAEAFKDVYYAFVSLSNCDFDTSAITEPAATVKLTFTNGTPDAVVRFGRSSATKYTIDVNGVRSRVTAAGYNKFIKALKEII